MDVFTVFSTGVGTEGTIKTVIEIGKPALVITWRFATLSFFTCGQRVVSLLSGEVVTVIC